MSNHSNLNITEDKISLLFLDFSLNKVFEFLKEEIIKTLEVDGIILNRVIKKDNKILIKRANSYIKEEYKNIREFWESLKATEVPIENLIILKECYEKNLDRITLDKKDIKDEKKLEYINITLSGAQNLDVYSIKKNDNIVCFLQLIWLKEKKINKDISDLIKNFSPYIEISLRILELEEKEINFTRLEESYQKILKLTSTINRINEKELYSHILRSLNQIFGFDMIFLQIEENGLLPVENGAVIEDTYKILLHEITKQFGKNGDPPIIIPPKGPEMANCIVFNSKSPIYFRDLNFIKNLPMREKDKIAVQIIEKHTQIKSILIIPIVENENSIGVAQLWSFKDFVDITQNEINMLKDLFSLIPSIKRNYQLHKEVEEKNRILEEKNSLIRKINQQIKKELIIASKIQQSLIEKNLPQLPNIKISAIYKPMEELGGDFYDIINIQDKIVGLFISDISGHGVPAALITMLVKSILDNAGIDKIKPKSLLESINNKILSYHTGQFLTAFYGLYNTVNKKFIYAKASHPQPILIREGKIIKLEGKGKVLGMLENINIEEKTIELEKNDKIILYTDGLTESTNENKEEFEPIFYQIIEKYSQLKVNELVEKIYFELLSFTGSYKLEDDVCILGFEVI